MKSSAARLIAFATAAALMLTPAARAQSTGTETVLYAFTNNGTNGEFPAGALLQGSNGVLYGTTEFGGSNSDGVVFALAPGSTPTNLHTFAGGQTDGANPSSGLVLGSDGAFYGTTPNGSNDGTVYKVTSGGAYTLVHQFTGGGTDGIAPNASLILGIDGNFYGTTSSGGSSGNGAVFSMTPAGVVTLLHSFPGDNTDGGYPLSSLVQTSDGTFYGTTSNGGSGSHGTVFSITSAGMFHTVYAFTATGTDGGSPEAALIVGGDGNLYGTTFYGGTDNNGTVYSLTPAGVHTTVYSFSGVADGANPQCRLLLGADGNFYGTAVAGGANNDGTVFQLTPAGVLTNLHSFGATSTDGVNPRAGLIQGSDGTFYGTTFYGGSGSSGGYGTIFKLVVSAGSTSSTVQFATTTYNTTENSGSVTLTVQRTGGSTGAVSVDYATHDNNAFAGTDYTATSGTLTWADGDATDKTITVPLIDRHLSDGVTLTFFLTLTNATGGASVGTNSSSSVLILDTETAPQPAIAIVSPPNGITVVAGSDLPLAASVVDPGGILSQVQFLVNGTQVDATTAAAPYLFDATAPAAPGTYTIGANAVDTQGRTSSASITLNVIAAQAGSTPPTSSLLTPVAGRNLAAGSTVTLSFTAASASTTTLAQVSLYADGAPVASFDGSGNPLTMAAGRPVRRDATASGLGIVFQTPYKLPGVDKIINLIVVALDNLGQSTVSKVASIHATVTTDQAPLVSLGGLTNGTLLAVGSTTTVSVSASDPDALTAILLGPGPVRADAAGDATLAALEYFINGVAQQGLPQPPYGFTFTPPTSGKYVLNAVATDGSGLATVSDPIVVEVNPPPTVNLAPGGTGVAVEGGANGVVVITRTGDDKSLPLTVSYKVKGAAVAGVDYKKLPGTVTIPVGAAKAKIKIKPIDGSPNAGTLKIKIVVLAPADGSYEVGTGAIKIKLIGK